MLLAHAPDRPALRGWSHAVAVIAAAVAGGVLIALAPGALGRTTMVVYTAGLCAMFGVSALYHRLAWTGVAYQRMRRLDHSTIYLAIAGTYTPVAVLALDGWSRVAVLTTVWVGSAIGIVLQWLPVQLPRWLSTAVYALVGWAAVIALPQAYAGLGGLGFGLVVAGGLCYTAGALVYATRRPDPWPRVFGFHEVFHALTVVAAGLHLAAVGFVVLPSA